MGPIISAANLGILFARFSAAVVVVPVKIVRGEIQHYQNRSKPAT